VSYSEKTLNPVLYKWFCVTLKGFSVL
jgi:hypothetical protein